jgi:hypothetical protein
MTKLIECSIEDVVAVNLSMTWTGKLRIKLPYGWKSHTYEQDEIEAIIPIDEDKYRSAGGAAAGAIIGGVLTGGVGLLVGAAIGGRRRTTTSFLFKFKDGNHVAITEKKGANLKVINGLLSHEKIKQLTSSDGESG